ncbi:MAG: LysR substrate-binding domain-containing protein [Alphaproteobacteria bacterium]|nr:LysR substrate-binding domain-containing protein [Alphaproteobacteria bacterium]
MPRAACAWWSIFHADQQAPAALAQVWGFRLYSVMVLAAVESMGVALGHMRMIAGELERGELVPLFDDEVPARARYVLCLAPDAKDKPGVPAFRDWLRA